MESTPAFSSASLQKVFAQHLRNPEKFPPPEGIEDRRIQVYRDLIYKNIESFLANGFPVLRKIYADSTWHAMVRDFLERHQSHSPYFLHIGAEFIEYLQNERESLASDPPFLLELAQYEWAELALYVSEEQLPASSTQVDPDILQAIPALSPLAWAMAFEYPVHQIGEGNIPDSAPAQPTYLVVYRNRNDDVKFLEINALSARLLALCEDNQTQTVQMLLAQIVSEAPAEMEASIISGGEAIVAQLRNLEIIYFR